MAGLRNSRRPSERRWCWWNSGPAGGVAGAVRVGEAIGETEILYLDVGGTTAKCSLIRNGRPVLRPDYKLEWSRINQGYPLQVPVVDIVEIGAGGGSIARVDENGSLKVGPQSAGSDPGPACYDRGGEDPTVTDAVVLTGAIDPHRFAGGRIKFGRNCRRRPCSRLRRPSTCRSSARQERSSVSPKPI